MEYAFIPLLSFYYAFWNDKLWIDIRPQELEIFAIRKKLLLTNTELWNCNLNYNLQCIKAIWTCKRLIFTYLLSFDIKQKAIVYPQNYFKRHLSKKYNSMFTRTLRAYIYVLGGKKKRKTSLKNVMSSWKSIFFSYNSENGKYTILTII